MDLFYLTIVNSLLIITFKILLKFTTGWDHSETCLHGKTVIITGANTGIGFHTALDFAKRGAKVILACRDKRKAEEAMEKIIVSSSNPNITIKIVDLASLASIRKFAQEIKSTEERLDILVNNAGVMFHEHSITEDGLTLTMQVNYFGPFLLTVLLLDLLKKSAPSRIVNVSSICSHLGKVNIPNLNARSKSMFPKLLDYANSKLCNVLFTNELARRVEGSGIDANSLHPGTVQTELFRYTIGLNKLFYALVSNLFFKTTTEGAQTSIYVAVSKEIDGVSGKYFSDCKVAWMPPRARNKTVAKQLWEVSEEIVKLTEDEKFPFVNQM